MENIGTLFPTLVLGSESDRFMYISIIIQVIVFIALIISIIRVIKFYLKNLELKKEPNKNQEEIEKNLEKMSKSIKLVVKIGALVFVLAIATQVISSLIYK